MMTIGGEKRADRDNARRETSSSVGPIPRNFHFVFGLKPQTEPFHLLFYICLKSCIEVNRPDNVFFHYHYEPYGQWWERIRPELRLRRVELDSFVSESPRYHEHNEGRVIRLLDLTYAHQADFLRLKILLEEGGVYADMDTLFVRPYENAWFDEKFVIGEEAAVADEFGNFESSLCNAVMLSRPGARFARKWLELGYRVFDGTWSRHSCQAAAKVRDEAPDDVSVLPSRYFYRFMWHREDLKALLEESHEVGDSIYSIHLWAHLWWNPNRVDFLHTSCNTFTQEFVRSVNTTYNVLARRFLPEE